MDKKVFFSDVYYFCPYSFASSGSFQRRKPKSLLNLRYCKESWRARFYSNKTGLLLLLVLLQGCLNAWILQRDSYFPSSMFSTFFPTLLSFSPYTYGTCPEGSYCCKHRNASWLFSCVNLWTHNSDNSRESSYIHTWGEMVVLTIVLRRRIQSLMGMYSWEWVSKRDGGT